MTRILVQQTPRRSRKWQQRADGAAMLALLQTYFGSEKQAIEFSRAFAGCNLNMPSPEIIDEIERDRAARAVHG